MSDPVPKLSDPTGGGTFGHHASRAPIIRRVYEISTSAHVRSLFFRKAFRRIRSLIGPDPDAFLKHARGVIHVGANYGQERAQYDRLGLEVIWIEPIPHVFEVLRENLKEYPRQRAIQALVTDRDDADYEFHISSNEGASSSIFDFKRHADIWPDVKHEKTIKLSGVTLASIARTENIDLTHFDALVLDTQGSELLVLNGAIPILHHFRYIKTEAADFEAYEGACQLADIERFMHDHGYTRHRRQAFAERAGGGTYFDVVYRRRV